MGRFSKLRGPALGWPVASPPPGEEGGPPQGAPPARGRYRAGPTAGGAGSGPAATVDTGAGLGAGAGAGAAVGTGARPGAGAEAGAAVDTGARPGAGAEATVGTGAGLGGEAGVGTGVGGATSFRDRARLRRRLQYLRRTRELAFRDLGGFVFDARRFNRPRQDIIEAKLKGLASMDRELRALETALDDRQELMLLHEPGITVCPRCGAIHGSDANFCSGCGLPRAGAGLPLGPRPPLPPAAGAGPAGADQPTLNLPAGPGSSG